MPNFLLMKSADSDNIELIARDDHTDFETITCDYAEELAKQILTLLSIEEYDVQTCTMQIPLRWQEDANGYYFVIADKIHIFMQSKILQKVKLTQDSRKVVLDKQEALDFASILLHFASVIDGEITAALDEYQWGFLMQAGKNGLIRDTCLVMLQEEGEFDSAFLYLLTNFPEMVPDICKEYGERLKVLFDEARFLNQNSIPSIFDRMHQKEIEWVESFL